MFHDFLYAPDSVNVALFHAVNGIQNPLYLKGMALGSMIGKYTLFPLYLVLIAAAAWQYGKLRYADVQVYALHMRNVRRMALSLTVAYVVYIIWVSGLKHLLHMSRPFAALPEGSFFVSDAVRNSEDPFVSLPSGHASFSLMMLVVMWEYLGKAGKAIGVSLVLWVGISRIALGAHFPFDVMSSWVLSLVITHITLLAARPMIENILNKRIPRSGG